MAGPNSDLNDLRVEVARIQEHLRATDAALSLQAKEYERRLDALNHAHAEARSILTTYLPREVYEKQQEILLLRVSVVENWKERLGGGAAAVDYTGRILWAVFGGLIIGAIVYILKNGGI